MCVATVSVPGTVFMDLSIISNVVSLAEPELQSIKLCLDRQRQRNRETKRQLKKCLKARRWSCQRSYKEMYRFC